MFKIYVLVWLAVISVFIRIYLAPSFKDLAKAQRHRGRRLIESVEG